MPVRRALALAIAIVAIACASAPPGTITRERAIEIARAQVKWEPFETSATRASSNGRSVWRVRLKGRLPGQPPELFETATFEIDAKTGAIVSAAKT